MQQLDEISAAIGGLQESIRSLQRDVDRVYATLQTEIEANRRSYHDLNNKTQQELGGLSVEMDQKVKSLDTRVAGLEVLSAKERTAHRLNVAWVSGIVSAIVSGAGLLAEYLRKGH